MVKIDVNFYLPSVDGKERERERKKERKKQKKRERKERNSRKRESVQVG